MGIISGAASILGVASKVTGTVMSLGSSALSFGGKFIKSFPGKLLIGAAVGSILSSKITGGQSIFGKLADGFKDFFSGMKQTATTAALTAATSVTNAGEQLSSTRDSLESMIASDAERGAPVYTEPAAAAAPEAGQQETEQNTPTGAEPAYGA